jgi:hypothetical protein
MEARENILLELHLQRWHCTEILHGHMTYSATSVCTTAAAGHDMRRPVTFLTSFSTKNCVKQNMIGRFTDIILPL